MTNIKKADIVSTYRNILDPLGYSVVRKESKVNVEWIPDDESIVRFTKMNSLELDSELSDLKLKQDGLKRDIEDVKNRILLVLNKEGPNGLTRSFFASTIGSSNTFNSRSIKIDSETLKETHKLISYLKELQVKVIAKELITRLQRDVPAVSDVFIESATGPASLVIKLR